MVVAVAVIAMVIQIGFVLLRFLNIGIINYKIKWFLIVVSE